MTTEGRDPAAQPDAEPTPPPLEPPIPEPAAAPTAATAPPTAAARPETRPTAVLAEAFTLAAGSSRLLRRASIYIGLLMLALAGPGVVAGLALLGSTDAFDPSAPLDEELATEAGRALILIALALVGAIIAGVEGAAIGITLLAGRVMDRPISLAAALQRSRRVFWRLIRAGLIVVAVEMGASIVWGLATGAVKLDDLENLTTEPIASAIATLPFVWATVAIVLADDGARAALRRSMSIARRNRLLTVALGLFGLLAGVVQTFALGSGLDLITRLTEALHLDITAGGLSFLLAAALALAIVMAAGSLLFTVTAIVNAPQVVAWSRLGLPLDGLPTEGLPTVSVAASSVATSLVESPPLAAPPPASPPVAAPPPASPPVDVPLPDAASAALASPDPASPELALRPQGWWQPAPPQPPPNAWAVAAAREEPFHWVTLPMRLTVIGMWLIAIASLAANRAP